ncbi:hypothetical protein [Peptostreptococcus equinus]|uniref:Uncharacterized protein n=1 Tax=Peptostreptococcus equinus TaxID=3003601 RepID=A0ABY7JPG9_9FIRM|nr:hypothetical protein [Peptostreptococcus sp. CBA3647]WAW14386.1 hypothetical protein O0R46_07200 [Peptostreptococcus sp. CBA3647]
MNQVRSTIISIMSFMFGIDKSQIFNNLLYHTLNETGGKYKGFSKRSSEVIIRDILNAELLLSNKEVCRNQKMLKNAKKYFDNTTIALLMSLRSSKDHDLKENISCAKQVLDIYSGDRIYLENTNSQDIPMKSACSRILRDNYSMSYDEISQHIGKSEGQIKRYLNEYEEESESFSGQIFYNIRSNTKNIHKKILEYQENKIFMRKSIRSKDYIMIDLNENIKSPFRMKIVSEKDVDKMFKGFNLDLLD